LQFTEFTGYLSAEGCIAACRAGVGIAAAGERLGRAERRHQAA